MVQMSTFVLLQLQEICIKINNKTKDFKLFYFFQLLECKELEPTPRKGKEMA